MVNIKKLIGKVNSIKDTCETSALIGATISSASLLNLSKQS